MSDENGIEPKQNHYRWVMLFLVWLLYTGGGLVARSLAPLVTPILEDLNMSYGQMGLVLGSWQFTYIIFSLIAGTILDKWGVRKALFLGTMVVGLSVSLRYFASGFGSLLFTVAMYGIGGSMISIGAAKTIALWFEGKERGTAVGFYSTAPRTGGLIALAGTNSLFMPLTGYNWRLIFVYYGIFIFAIALLWWLLARDTKPARDTENISILRVFTGLIKVRNVRIVLIAGFLSFTIMHGFNHWLPKILESSGYSPTSAGLYASLPLLVGIPTALVFPRMIPPHLRGRWVAFLAFLVAVSLLLSVNILAFPLALGLIFFGVAGASLLPLLMLLLMDTPEVGSQYMGAAGGIFFCTAEIGGFAGPLIMGVIVDITEGFMAGITFLACLSLIIIMVMFLLKAPFTSKQDAG